MTATKVARYEVYKNSGAAWMGDIPEHWKFVRVKDLISKITSGVTPRGGAESYVNAGIPFLRSQNVHNDGLRLDDVSFISEGTHQEMTNSQVKPGDIVFNITGASIARTCIVPEAIKTANISQHIALLRPRKLNETKFISYYLQSQLVKDYVYLTQSGASKEAFNHGQMKCIPVSLPSRHEQTAIAKYLDTKTVQIDRQIGLLGQKATQYGKLKQSLINETVTCGLDKSVPMKDSGVDWIGEVPAHWRVKRGVDFLSMTSNQVSTHEMSGKKLFHYSIPIVQETGTGRIESGSDIDSNKLRITGDELLFSKLNPRKETICITKTPTIGQLTVASGEFLVLKPLRRCYSLNYCYYLFCANYNKSRICSTVKSVTKSHQRANPSDIHKLSFVLPPIEEQKIIVSFLDEKTTQIDRIVTTISIQIDKLKDLRKALINDVVTGKIKVVSEEGQTV